MKEITNLNAVHACMHQTLKCVTDQCKGDQCKGDKCKGEKSKGDAI